MNIYLIGYRCTGKTTVGQALAERLNLDFIDADDYLERRAGTSIKAIFAAEGEKGFRQRECEVIAELAQLDGKVIAAGGGAILNEQNVEHMRRSGRVVLLEADADTIYGRITRDVRTESQRPSLTDRNQYEEIKHLLDYRKPFYDRAADMTFDTSALSIHEVVDGIVEALDKGARPAGTRPMEESPAT